MNTQEVISFMRHEWHQAILGVSEQWHHLRQRSNHAIVSFHTDGDTEEDVEWGLVPVEMYESDDRLVIRAEVPGLDGDSVQVKVEGSNLIITGHKLSPQDIASSAHYFNREVVYGDFERSIPLPHLRIDEQNNSASCSNGILTIALPLQASSDRSERSISVH